MPEEKSPVKDEKAEETYFTDKNITITNKKVFIKRRKYLFYTVTIDMPLSNICSCEIKTIHRDDPCLPATHYEFSLVIFLRNEMRWKKLVTTKDRNYLDMLQTILADALGNK
jgi:hypothetical protein